MSCISFPAEESNFASFFLMNHDKITLNLSQVLTNQSFPRINFYIYKQNVQVRKKTTKDQDINGHFFIPNKLQTIS